MASGAKSPYEYMPARGSDGPGCHHCRACAQATITPAIRESKLDPGRFTAQRRLSFGAFSEIALAIIPVAAQTRANGAHGRENVTRGKPLAGVRRTQPIRVPFRETAQCARRRHHLGHPDMPEFVFGNSDVGAIIAYLKSIQEPLLVHGADRRRPQKARRVPDRDRGASWHARRRWRSVPYSIANASGCAPGVGFTTGEPLAT
jgi:hypothetical protein